MTEYRGNPYQQFIRGFVTVGKRQTRQQRQRARTTAHTLHAKARNGQWVQIF